MSKVTKMKTVKDRNMRYKPWSPLIPYEVPELYKADGIVAAFQNHIITVFMKAVYTDSFTNQQLREDNKVAVYQLMCQWTDPNRGGDIDLKYLNRAKDEICEPDCEAVYHFPATYREVKTRFTDVWVFEKGFMLPFGRVPSMDEMESRMKESLGEVEKLTKEDVEVFVVHYEATEENAEIREVFASEEECQKQYGNENYKKASCAVQMLGSVPPQSSDCAWSDGALQKLNRVIALAGRPIEIQNEEAGFFDDHVSEEDIVIGVDKYDNGPRSDEEHVAMADAMKRGMDAKADARVKALRESINGAIADAQDSVEHALGGVRKNVE